MKACAIHVMERVLPNPYLPYRSFGLLIDDLIWQLLIQDQALQGPKALVVVEGYIETTSDK